MPSSPRENPTCTETTNYGSVHLPRRHRRIDSAGTSVSVPVVVMIETKDSRPAGFSSTPLHAFKNTLASMSVHFLTSSRCLADLTELRGTVSQARQLEYSVLSSYRSAILFNAVEDYDDGFRDTGACLMRYHPSTDARDCDICLGHPLRWSCRLKEAASMMRTYQDERLRRTLPLQLLHGTHVTAINGQVDDLMLFLHPRSDILADWMLRLVETRPLVTSRGVSTSPIQFQDRTLRSILCPPPGSLSDLTQEQRQQDGETRRAAGAHLYSLVLQRSRVTPGWHLHRGFPVDNTYIEDYVVSDLTKVLDDILYREILNGTLPGTEPPQRSTASSQWPSDDPLPDYSQKALDN